MDRIKALITKAVLNRKPCDFTIVILVVILVIFGIVMVFSASYYKSINETGSAYAYLKRQLFFGVTGCGFMYIASLIDYHKWRRWAPLILVGSLILLLLMFTPLSVEVNGATRWLRFGPISIMPGEVAKLALILFTAGVLASNDKYINKPKIWGMLILITLLFAGLIVLQPNLSTAITCVGIVGCMMVLAGFNLIVTGTILGAGVAAIIVLGNTDTYWGKRITSFMDPFADPKGDGYQAAQSLLALGTGGIRGLGLGKSVQKNLYLPEPQNDFILAIIGEELGLVRVLILLLVFLFLIWRCFLVAMNAQDKYGMYLASGVSLMIGLQVVLNVAVVTSSMPPTGIALPFIGYGGNAIWIFLFSMGILLNVSRSAHIKPLIKPRSSQNRVEKVRQKQRESLI